MGLEATSGRSLILLFKISTMSEIMLPYLKMKKIVKLEKMMLQCIESRKLYGPFHMAILLIIASAAHTLKEENIHWNFNWQILRLLTDFKYI